MRTDGAARYPGHIKPLDQVVLAIQAMRHRKLRRQQLPEIFPADSPATTAVLQLLDCQAKSFFLRFGKLLRAPVMRRARQAVHPAAGKPAQPTHDGMARHT
jgi:hypothetical protein